MTRVTLATALPLLAAIAVGVAPPAATAGDSEVVLTAADGRELRVGSLVTQGTRQGATCVFPDGASALTLLAPDDSDVSVAVTATDSCALVVSELTVGGGVVDLGLGELAAGDVATGDMLVDRPKIPRDGTDGASPSSLGGAPGGVSVGGDLAPGDLLAAAAVETKSVKVWNTVYGVTTSANVNTVEYEDYWHMQYLRDTTRRTVYGSEYLHGGCRSGMKVQPPTIDDCWYDNKSRPGVVKFWAGGYYEKYYGPVWWDARPLNETYEATYDTSRRHVAPQENLPPGWRHAWRWSVTTVTDGA